MIGTNLSLRVKQFYLHARRYSLSKDDVELFKRQSRLKLCGSSKIRAPLLFIYLQRLEMKQGPPPSPFTKRPSDADDPAAATALK